jgi:uncharacterized membrane protein
LQEPVFDFENNSDPRVTRDEITLGVIAHALSFIEGGIIGPLILYLIKRNDSPFVAFHALQSLYWGLLFVGVATLSIITCIGPFVCAVVYVVYEVIACFKASEGKWYQLHLAGKWALGSHPIPACAPDQAPPQDAR